MIRKLVNFLVRQLTRYQYGVSKFSFVFQVSNFVSLLLLLLTQVGLSLKMGWVALIYVLMFVSGLIIIFVIESIGGWHTDTFQLFSMKEKRIFQLKTKLNSYYIALAMKLSEEELLEQIETVQNSLFQKNKPKEGGKRND